MENEKINDSSEYAREYYNNLGKSLPGEYASYRWFSTAAARLDYRETRRALLFALGNQKYDRVLEVGCGDGIWTSFLIERSSSVHAIEQSEEMLRRAQERLKNIGKLTFERNDFLKSIPKAEYDLVVSVRVFEYFGDKDLAASNFFNFLKPGGSLILITKSAKRSQKDIAKGSEHLHSIEIGMQETIHILEKAGFKVERVYPAIMKWYPDLSIFTRGAFEFLHLTSLFGARFFRIVNLLPSTTESYVYIARKK